jgi:hypothetical protein
MATGWILPFVGRGAVVITRVKLRIEDKIWLLTGFDGDEAVNIGIRRLN